MSSNTRLSRNNLEAMVPLMIMKSWKHGKVHLTSFDTYLLNITSYIPISIKINDNASLDTCTIASVAKCKTREQLK